MKKLNLAKSGIKPSDMMSVCFTALASGMFDVHVENSRLIKPLLGIPFSRVLQWARPGVEQKMFAILENIMVCEGRSPKFRFQIRMSRLEKLMGVVRKQECAITVAKTVKPKSTRGRWMKKTGMMARNCRRKEFVSKQEIARQKLEQLLSA